MKISREKLTNFLRVANKATYANEKAPRSTSLRPSSQDYHFEQGGLTYHDTYFGARDFLGEEIVYEGEKPVWGMNYYGFIADPAVSVKNTYTFLRAALLQDYSDILPVRGPGEYLNGTGKYENEVVGELDRFSGEEKIHLDGKLVYRCWYHGGSID